MHTLLCCLPCSSLYCINIIVLMNPCPCGYYPDRKCKCTVYEVNQYIKRISGPLVDRIDISVEVGKISWEQIHNSHPDEPSSSILKRVNSAIKIQQDRYEGLGELHNSNLSNENIKIYCEMSEQATRVLQRAYEKYELSPRSLGRIKKVARTIADLEKDELIHDSHICEAIALNKGLWHLVEERK